MPAIDRWAKVMGEAPPSSEPANTKAGRRLNPVFVEWMMGLAPGWVTGHGLKRITALRLLGNGVVPRQGSTALHILLQMKEIN